MIVIIDCALVIAAFLAEESTFAVGDDGAGIDLNRLAEIRDSAVTFLLGPPVPARD
jgi:hypothetical protein